MRTEQTGSNDKLPLSGLSWFQKITTRPPAEYSTPVFFPKKPTCLHGLQGLRHETQQDCKRDPDKLRKESEQRENCLQSVNNSLTYNTSIKYNVWLLLRTVDDSALHVPPPDETLDIPRLVAVMRALGDLEDVNDKLKRENDSRLARIRAEWEVVITTQLELTARGERIRERRQEIIENAMREDK